jgi:hypothetical protein
MALDYEKEERAFLEELNAGQYGIERMPNTETDYREKEERDVKAFDNYLASESFKALNASASK